MTANRPGLHVDEGAGDAGQQRDLILSERARLLGTPPAPMDSRTTSVVAFRVRNDSYAVDVGWLRSIETAQRLTPVPCAPSFVAGLINLRGEMLTVLDLGVALELPGTASHAGTSRILVAGLPGITVGLLVDSVTDVMTVASSDFEAPLSGREFATGIVDGDVTVLDLVRLLTNERFGGSHDSV